MKPLLSPKTRYRSLNTQWLATGTDVARDYVKRNGCNSTATWQPYYEGALSYPCGRVQVMQDVVVPGFAFRRAQGEVFFSPMRKYTCEIEPGSGFYGGKFRNNSAACSGAAVYYPMYEMNRTGLVTYGRSWAGFSFPSFVPNVSFPIVSLFTNLTEGDALDVRAEASTACLSQRGRVSDQNLWETMAEMDQAFGMVGSLSDSLRKVILSSKARIVVQGVASMWLLYRYGIQPLISDIKATVKALEKIGGKRRQTSRGMAAITKTGHYPLGGSAYATYTWQGKVQTTETYACRAMSLDEVIVSFADEVGLGLKNLITLPWELVTKSFVLDWFLNFGDLFGAVVPALNATQLGSCMVTQHDLRSYFYTTDYAARSGITMLDPPDLASCEMRQGYTTRVLGLENPALVIRADFGLHKWRRACDSLALLSLAIKGLPDVKHKPFRR